MVGIFSRFSRREGRHRRAQSEINEKVGVTYTEEPASVTSAIPHGFEVAVEFKPVEHPVEPPDTDQPVKCPLPEQSILNDGRIWKERISSTNMRKRTELPIMKEDARLRPGNPVIRKQFLKQNRSMAPSVSAPEGNIIN